MSIFENHSPDELPRYCGSLQQIARIASYELNEGRGKGVSCLDFHTGSGFNFTVVPDRGMDIAHAEYKGRNLCWISPAGIASPPYYEPAGQGWMRSFFGGLLTTCGLAHVGWPDEYRGETFGQHGRVSNIPAHHVSHDMLSVGGEYFLVCRGQVREARPMLYNLLLKRSVQTKAGQKHLRIHDVVTNEGYEPWPLQMLYHVNVGFPVLDRTGYFAAASKSITPRDDIAADTKENYRLMEGPSPGAVERCYYHEIAPAKDGYCSAAMINPDLDDGIGVYVKYRADALPWMTQWKMTGEGTYVMGLEPCNSFGLGFERQKQLGILRMVQPGEHIDFYVEIGVLDGANEIDMFEDQISRLAPEHIDYSTPLV